MIPVFSYDEILSRLTGDFEYWQRPGVPLTVTMCGLLFARPQVELAAKEIFPEIDYFNTRLGPHFHLFTAGCYFHNPGPPLFEDERPVASTRHWIYSDNAFDLLRREIEGVTSWRYRDGLELLLMNATRNHATRKASLDFHSAISIDLQKMQEANGPISIAKLIGALANYCETYRGDDPTWGFSDNLGVLVGRSAIWNLFVSLLPDGVRHDVNTALLFVTQDLSRRKSV